MPIDVRAIKGIQKMNARNALMQSVQEKSWLDNRVARRAMEQGMEAVDIIDDGGVPESKGK